MGLQTVTWLLDRELVHYDSLRPGGVKVMTSGAAIGRGFRKRERSEAVEKAPWTNEALPPHRKHPRDR